MSTQSDSSVIHKKATNGREDFDARAMSWAKALRLSLERCGDRLFNMALTVCALEQSRSTLADLKHQAQDDRLIVLLDGQSGTRGAVIFDSALVQSLVEVQTRGSVTSAAPGGRSFTNADAALAAPLIDAVLSDFDEMMQEAPFRPEPLDFRFGDRVEDGRVLLLALDAPEFELFQVTLDIGHGAKMGELVLALPSNLLARSGPPKPNSGEKTTGFDISEVAMSAPVALEVVLDRVQMPLAQVCAMKPGMTLPISRTAIARVELLAARRHKIAEVCLGQMNGFRAVRFGTSDVLSSPGGKLAVADAEPATSPRDDPKDSSGAVPIKGDAPQHLDLASMSMPDVERPLSDQSDALASLEAAAIDPQQDGEDQTTDVPDLIEELPLEHESPEVPAM